MEKLVVENCPACEPIMEVLELLINRGLIVYSQECRDPHFNELRFILTGNFISDVNEIHINGIEMTSPNKFICECHWSIVEILSNDALLE